MVDLSAVEIGVRLKVADDLRGIGRVERYYITESMSSLSGQIVTVVKKRDDYGISAVAVAEIGTGRCWWEGVCFDYVEPPVALSEYIFQEDLR